MPADALSTFYISCDDASRADGQLDRLTMLIISVRSLASRTLTMAGGCSVVCSLEVVPDFPGPP